MAPTAAAAATMTSSPIVTVNLWLDGPITSEPFIGLVGGPMHWIFNKSALYADRTSHLSIVASGAVDLVSHDNAAITDAAWRQLQRALPTAAARRVTRSVVVREHRATFSVAPGAPSRPADRHAARRILPRGRLDRYRASRHDRKRSRQRTPGGGQRGEYLRSGVKGA